MPARRISQDVLDAGLAVGGQAPQVRAPDHHRAGAERERLDDVAAAPDAAVEQDLDLSPTASTIAGSARIDGRRAVEVVAAVVGDRDRVGADLDRAPGVVGVHHALDAGTGPPTARAARRCPTQVGGGVRIHSP